MFKSILADWLKQYLPILINSMCTAVCVALAGCKLTADNIAVEITPPASYHHSTTNTPN